MEFVRSLTLHVRAHRLGFVTAAETGYKLGTTAEGRDVVRAPDVGFISHAKLPDGCRRDTSHMHQDKGRGGRRGLKRLGYQPTSPLKGLP